MEGRPLADPKSVQAFALAGKAHLTLRSLKSGDRFTYRIKKTGDGRAWFVSVLAGADNDSAYSYMGLIRNGRFFQTARSRVSEDAPAWLAFNWFHEKVIKLGLMPEALEVWHEGRCGRCARRLTVPESIETGFGPECRHYVCD